MKPLKLALVLACLTAAGDAATITVTQGFGTMGLLVTSDGVTPVPFFWAVGNWASDSWTQFGAVVPDTDKVNGTVTAQEPASLNNQIIHLWIGLGAVGTQADFSTPWIILRTNVNTAFPPDVSAAGGTTFNAAIGNSLTLVATGNGVEWAPTATGGGIVFWPGNVLSVSADHGTVDGAGIYPPDTPAVLTATPHPGYRFTGWAGDATGSDNPLAVLMDSDKWIEALFEPDLGDTDGDGLTNYQECVEQGTDPLVADSDGDGLPDGAEVQLALTNPHLPDTDGDGLLDGAEVNLTLTNPLLVDSDGDGTADGDEDPDGDGLPSLLETDLYATHPALADTDGDGLTDGWEAGFGRFSIVPGSFTWAQARADAHARGGELACFPTEERWNRAIDTLGGNALDPYLGLWVGATDEVEDGTWVWVNGEPFSFSPWATTRPSTTAGNTLDYVEVSGGDGAEIGNWYDRSPTSVRDGYFLEMGFATDPLAADSDGDTLSDGQETTLTATNPLAADTDGDGTPDALEDGDGDGLTHGEELATWHTNPSLADTDGDGMDDGQEVIAGRNPLKIETTVTLGSLAHVYDGSPKGASATTEPAGLTVSFRYDGAESAPVNAGSYAVVATIDDPSYTGSATGTLVIEKAAATVTLRELAHTYDGNPKAAAATTDPAGLTVTLTYDGSPAAPVDAGSHAVVATVEDPNHHGTAAGTLVIDKAAATITLAGLAQTYDGSPKPATATTEPAGLAVDITYGGSPAPPTNAGAYMVSATVADANHEGSAAGQLLIGKAAAGITLGNLAQVYDGTPKPASATTEPPGLAVTLAYDGSPMPPVHAGTSSVVATIDDVNYHGTAGGSLVIAKAAATVTLGGMAQTYDGSPKAACAETAPAGLSVVFTYDGSPIPPTGAGSYEVVGAVAEADYGGTATGTMVVTKAAATVTLGALQHVWDGTPKAATAATVPAGLAVALTYDGAAAAPTAAGVYQVVATVQDANHAGSAGATLTIFDVFTLVAGAVNGTASGSGDYVEGATASIEATPDPGYLFTGWTGDAGGTDNPLSVLMDSDKTIGATFEPDLADGDGDGLTNYQEGAIHHTDPGLADSDGDGLDDGYEVGAGRFRVVWGDFRWGQAMADAERCDGHLATFKDQEEWDAAFAGLAEDPLPWCTGLWIGATDAATEGAWEWVTGEPFAFNLWAPGQPNNFPGEQDVAEVAGWFGAATPGEWLDTGAAALREGYLLEEGWPTDPANADTDGDSYLDGAEAEFMGDPLAAGVVPRVRARVVVDPGAGSAQFRFLAEQGATYAIEASTNLADWETIETGIPGTGGTVWRDYPMDGMPRRYFRSRRE